MRLKLLAVGLVLLSSTLVARADDLYTVSFSALGDSGTYTFVEPSILTSPFSVSASDLTSSTQSGDVLTEIEINPTDSMTSGECYSSGDAACLILSFSPPGGLGLTDVNDAFTSPLTSTGSYGGSLTNVSIEPYTAATPEPGSLALLGTGVLGFAGVLRRRLA